MFDQIAKIIGYIIICIGMIVAFLSLLGFLALCIVEYFNKRMNIAYEFAKYYIDKKNAKNKFHVDYKEKNVNR